MMYPVAIRGVASPLAPEFPMRFLASRLNLTQWVCRTTLLGGALLLLLPSPALAQPAISDAGTSPSSTRRVRLQPVLRPKESTVRLKPVLRGQTTAPKPAPTAKPKAAATPEPAPAAAQAMAPATAPPVVAAVPRTGGSIVRQPALPPPLQPGQRPPKSAALARADRRILAARALIDKGEVDEARKYLFQLALEIHGTPEGARSLLMAALALDDLEQTKQELREIIRAYPSGDVTRVAFSRLGELNFILGNYEDSIAAYRDLRKVAESPEQRRQADFRIALALQRSGQYEAALQAIDEVARTYPDLLKTPELIEAHGEALMANGKIREAGERFHELETDFPNYQSAAKVLMNRGLCAELLGDADAARRHYTLISEEYPGSLEANLAAGRLEDLRVPLIAAATE